jgi:hypothetical protein
MDLRTARPEPFEHSFGAEAHPAEPTGGDPASAHGDAAGGDASGSTTNAAGPDDRPGTPLPDSTTAREQ